MCRFDGLAVHEISMAFTGPVMVTTLSHAVVSTISPISTYADGRINGITTVTVTVSSIPIHL